MKLFNGAIKYLHYFSTSSLKALLDLYSNVWEEMEAMNLNDTCIFNP